MTKCIIVTLLAFACGTAVAQTITVRVVDVKDGHPLAKRSVALSLLFRNAKTGTDRSTRLQEETDANGDARFVLTNTVPDHLGIEVDLAPKDWLCGCNFLASTDDVISKGVRGPFAREKTLPAMANPEPGEIVVLAKSTSFWQRLLYPLTKQ